jgi:hypothetical protein
MWRRLLSVLVILVGLGAFLSLRRAPLPSDIDVPSPYHPSSPDLIAATGRPQLIEFFHKA